MMRTNLAGSVVVLVGDCKLLSFVNLSCICMALYGFKLYHIFIQFLATYLTKLRKPKQDLQTQWKKYHVILEAVAYGQGMIFLKGVCFQCCIWCKTCILLRRFRFME